jgi:hypothetical protein
MEDEIKKKMIPNKNKYQSKEWRSNLKKSKGVQLRNICDLIDYL